MKRFASTRRSNLDSVRHKTLLRLWLLLILTGTLPGSTLFAQPSRSQPLHTNQPKFRIPFEYDAEEMARLRAVEIQLYVSTNQGRDWEHAQSVVPSEANFTFEASEDFEYWFAVRTLDEGNQRHPPGPLQPGLRVVIDRVSPEFELRLWESAAGEVELTWSADDEHLDLNTINLEFLDGNSEEWRSVAITAAANGRTSWNVPRTGRVRVRGSIEDRAGNSRSAEDSIELGTVRRQAPRPATPDFSQPVAEIPSDTEDVAGRTEASTVRSSLTSSDDEPLIQPAPLTREEFPQIVSLPAESVEPIPQSFPSAAQPEQIPQTSSDIPRVNSSQFNMNYEVDEVGTSGIGKVDLYITEDDGEKWYMYGSDEDQKSPFLVEVPEDGEYGFALRVHSGAGLAVDPPQPGDGPEMTVVVDRQPPEAELVSVRQGTESAPAQVQFQWEVADEQLDEQPVALYYAARSTGPWEEITGWSENTGEYTWNIGSDIPSKMYFRLEARDAAGNVARVDSETPLEIDLTRPSARFVDVESVQSE